MPEMGSDVLEQAIALVTGRIAAPDDEEFDDTGFLHAPAIRDVGEALIGRWPELGFLAAARVAYLWKRSGGKAKGKPRFAQIQKPTGLLAFYSRADYAVWLAADHCRQAAFSNREYEALVYHELCHAESDVADDGGVVWSVRGHDLETFRSEIERYGVWTPDLRHVAPAFRQMGFGE